MIDTQERNIVVMVDGENFALKDPKHFVTHSEQRFPNNKILFYVSDYKVRKPKML